MIMLILIFFLGIGFVVVLLTVIWGLIKIYNKSFIAPENKKKCYNCDCIEDLIEIKGTLVCAACKEYYIQKLVENVDDIKENDKQD
jgi:hypothetical protein